MRERSNRRRKEAQHEQRHPADGRQGVKLRTRPAGRRPVLHGLHGADHLPAVPEDGRRADQAALLPQGHRAQGPRLAEPAGEGGRRPGGPLPPRLRTPERPAWDAGGDLQEGQAGDPEPRLVAPPDRGPDRQGAVAVDAGRREGRHLRGPAGQERRGVAQGSGPVFHASGTHQGHRGRDAAHAGRDDLRPRLRHRRLPPGRSRLRHPAARQNPGPRPEAAPAQGPGAGLGACAEHGPPRRHEPLPTRYRRPPPARSRRRWTASPATLASGSAWS